MSLLVANDLCRQIQQSGLTLCLAQGKKSATNMASASGATPTSKTRVHPNPANSQAGKLSSPSIEQLFDWRVWHGIANVLDPGDVQPAGNKGMGNGDSSEHVGEETYDPEKSMQDNPVFNDDDSHSIHFQKSLGVCRFLVNEASPTWRVSSHGQFNVEQLFDPNQFTFRTPTKTGYSRTARSKHSMSRPWQKHSKPRSIGPHQQCNFAFP